MRFHLSLLAIIFLKSFLAAASKQQFEIEPHVWFFNPDKNTEGLCGPDEYGGVFHVMVENLNGALGKLSNANAIHWQDLYGNGSPSRRLRAKQDERELNVCLCPGCSWLGNAYCDGHKGRYLMTLPEDHQDESHGNRELLSSNMGLALEKQFKTNCQKALKDIKLPNNKACETAMKESECDALVHVIML